MQAGTSVIFAPFRQWYLFNRGLTVYKKCKQSQITDLLVANDVLDFKLHSNNSICTSILKYFITHANVRSAQQEVLFRQLSSNSPWLWKSKESCKEQKKNTHTLESELAKKFKKYKICSHKIHDTYRETTKRNQL